MRDIDKKTLTAIFDIRSAIDETQRAVGIRTAANRSKSADCAILGAMQMTEQNDHLQYAFQGMLEYGRSTIRSLFLLNAGAIVALLAFLSAVIEFSDDRGSAAPFVPGLWAFIVGLSFAVLALFSVYWNFMTAYQNPLTQDANQTLGWTQCVATVCGGLSGLSFLGGAALISSAIAAL